MELSVTTCGETSPRQLHDGNASIEENNFNAKHKHEQLSPNAVSQLEDYEVECGLSDSFSKTVKLLQRSSTMCTKMQGTNMPSNFMNITQNTSEKLVKASDQYPTDQSLKPLDWS